MNAKKSIIQVATNRMRLSVSDEARKHFDVIQWQAAEGYIEKGKRAETSRRIMERLVQARERFGPFGVIQYGWSVKIMASREKSADFRRFFSHGKGKLTVVRSAGDADYMNLAISLFFQQGKESLDISQGFPTSAGALLEYSDGQSYRKYQFIVPQIIEGNILAVPAVSFYEDLNSAPEGSHLSIGYSEAGDIFVTYGSENSIVLRSLPASRRWKNDKAELAALKTDGDFDRTKLLTDFVRDFNQFGLFHMDFAEADMHRYVIGSPYSGIQKNSQREQNIADAPFTGFALKDSLTSMDHEEYAKDFLERMKWSHLSRYDVSLSDGTQLNEHFTPVVTRTRSPLSRMDIITTEKEHLGISLYREQMDKTIKTEYGERAVWKEGYGSYKIPDGNVILNLIDRDLRTEKKREEAKAADKRKNIADPYLPYLDVQNVTRETFKGISEKANQSVTAKLYQEIVARNRIIAKRAPQPLDGLKFYYIAGTDDKRTIFCLSEENDDMLIRKADGSDIAYDLLDRDDETDTEQVEGAIVSPNGEISFILLTPEIPVITKSRPFSKIGLKDTAMTEISWRKTSDGFMYIAAPAYGYLKTTTIKRFPHVRKVEGILSPEQFFSFLDVTFVRINCITVQPWPFFYLRIYAAAKGKMHEEEKEKKEN